MEDTIEAADLEDAPVNVDCRIRVATPERQKPMKRKGEQVAKESSSEGPLASKARTSVAQPETTVGDSMAVEANPTVSRGESDAIVTDGDASIEYASTSPASVPHDDDDMNACLRVLER